MSRHRLRPATADDRPELLDLWVAAWAVTLPAIDFSARRRWFEARLGDLAEAGSITLVARDAAGRLGGFVIVDPATHDLDQLAVAPDLRGSGLAVRLLDEAKRRAAGRLTLRVNRDNGRAARFYAREGFRTVAAEVNPRSGLPVWRMEWSDERVRDGAVATVGAP